MSLPLRDKLLLCLASQQVARQTACRVREGSFAPILGLILGVIALLTGCERREVVRPTPQMDVEARFWIRVLLTPKNTECTLSGPAQIHVDRYAANAITAPSTDAAITAPVKVTVVNGQLHFGADPQSERSVVVSTAAPHVLAMNDQSYRGKLRLTLNADNQTFSIINLVPLEPYLAGVVGAEMPNYWELEALKAQAIAARTYCLYTKERFGARRDWDVSSTQASQVYRGVSAESARVWKAVMNTYGIVLVSRNEHGNDKGLFPAYYSSICGGHTEASEYVFGEAFGPLRGVSCPHCKDVARLGMFFWPMAQFDRETVNRRLMERYTSLEALDEIQDIVVLNKSDYGPYSRLTRIQLVGTNGKTDTLRGEDLRLSLDPTGRKIQSMVCQIVPWSDGWAFLSGRGWGHGVGMCQCGAEGMARQGHSAEDILNHYYPDSESENVYQ